MLIIAVILILSLLGPWYIQTYNWTLCNGNEYYDQYVYFAEQCDNGQIIVNDGIVVRILPKLDMYRCLTGPNASANDVCSVFYDLDHDGSVTLRDVSIWLYE